MMRLNAPEKNYETTFDESVDGITGNNNLKARLVAARPDFLQLGSTYIASANNGELYAIGPIDATANPNPVVVGGVLKSELINLYEYYFRHEEKEARKIYDNLLNSAHERCPFCGGIGTPRNLDHFLPKAHFPQFSILPQNLVPSCRDCNMDGKSESFAKTASEQVIQPYLDHDRFFTSQWIFADYLVISNNMPGTLRYFVRPPEEWDQIYKNRIHRHFSDFDLAKRYAVKAAELLGTTLSQISAMRRRGVSNAIIRDDLLTPGIESAPFINHWQKGMFQALFNALP